MDSVICKKYVPDCFLTVGKNYDVINTACMGLIVKIKDDRNIEDWYHIDVFSEDTSYYQKLK